MTPLNFLLLALFAWYVTYILIRTSGPFNVFARLRSLTTLGGLLECMYCLVVWVALLGYGLLSTPLTPVVYVGAIAGGAMILHRYTGGDHL